jgi:predicted transposase YbfD/YdcC
VHYVRDVTFDEDRSRIRTGTAAQIMSSIRNVVIGILRIIGATNIAKAIRYCHRNINRPLRILGLQLQ